MTDCLHTRCVHAGSLEDPSGGVNSPLSLSSAFAYLGESGVLYPRYYNTPNQAIVANKLAQLEEGEAGLLFASGMAAISNVLLAHLRSGDHLVLPEGCYGGTEYFIQEEMPRLGIQVSYCALDADAVIAAVGPKTRMIYVESPTNPLLGVVDLAKVAHFARAHGVLTVVDNTFATPVCQRPLALGCDIVVHSATKYLGGHSDLSAGAVVTSAALMAPIHATAVRYGGCLNALDAWLLERSMKTLALRVERQSANALSLASALSQLAQIRQVFYPGLDSHPGHAVAARQMQGFGAMLSFELAPDIDPGGFEGALKLIRSAVSLGGVESTICRPSLTSHAKLSAAQRQALGISDGVMRLSVGIEGSDDLLDDIRQALARSVRG